MDNYSSMMTTQPLQLSFLNSSPKSMALTVVVTRGVFLSFFLFLNERFFQFDSTLQFSKVSHM